MHDEIRRIVGDDNRPLSTVKDALAKADDAHGRLKEALAKADAARLQMADLERRLNKLEANRGITAPEPAAVTRTVVQPTPTTPAALSPEDIQRALAEMPAHERAHLLIRLALAVPYGRRGK